jgi:hypothetical protein
VAFAPAVGCGTTSPNRWSPRNWLTSISSSMLSIRLAASAAIVCLITDFTLAGEPAFDTLYLRDRTKNVGVFLGRDSQHAYLAVRRHALETSKGAIRGYLKKADDEERIAYEQLRDRTQAMVQEPQHEAYRFVIEQERDRAARWLDGTERTPSKLVILTIPAADVAKVELAARDNHGLALWAWYKQIDAPELSDASTLRRTLEKDHMDFLQEPPDLGLRFQAVPQNGDEWQARIALVRYSRDREIEFQGTPGMMVRVGDRNAPADVAKLLTQGMQQQSQTLLDELLHGRKSKERDWLESCELLLTEEREDYFRASCMEQDIAGNGGSVESVFAVRLGKEWKTLWKTNLLIDLDSVPSGTQQQVENDPQIRSLLAIMKSLGIGSEEAMDRALKMGAATMQAQSKANQEFERFRQRFQHRLDLPILRWDITSPSRGPPSKIDRRR